MAIGCRRVDGEHVGEQLHIAEHAHAGIDARGAACVFRLLSVECNLPIFLGMYEQIVQNVVVFIGVGIEDC